MFIFRSVLFYLATPLVVLLQRPNRLVSRMAVIIRRDVTFVKGAMIALRVEMEMAVVGSIGAVEDTSSQVKMLMITY